MRRSGPHGIDPRHRPYFPSVATSRRVGAASRCIYSSFSRNDHISRSLHNQYIPPVSPLPLFLPLPLSTPLAARFSRSFSLFFSRSALCCAFSCAAYTLQIPFLQVTPCSVHSNVSCGSCDSSSLAHSDLYTCTGAAVVHKFFGSWAGAGTAHPSSAAESMSSSIDRPSITRSKPWFATTTLLFSVLTAGHQPDSSPSLDVAESCGDVLLELCSSGGSSCAVPLPIAELAIEFEDVLGAFNPDWIGIPGGVPMLDGLGDGHLPPVIPDVY